MTTVARQIPRHDSGTMDVVRSGSARVSYERYGSGPPLVLVHGSFTDHRTNWEFVAPALAERFTVHAVARRGRGETEAPGGRRVEDEGRDIAALVETIDDPVFLLGHSYGALVALHAAADLPHRIRKLALYEPPHPDILRADHLTTLEAFSAVGDWDGFATSFFRLVLRVPDGELDDLRASDLWPPIVADAEASLGDVRTLAHYTLDMERFRELRCPVLLQVGTECPPDLFLTDALAAVLPDVRVGPLAGQAHEAMLTAPGQYVEAVSGFFRE